LVEIGNDRHALEFWRDAFGKELKNEFINQVCPFLERRANDHLEGLGNSQIKVSVSTRKVLKSAEDRSEFTITASSSSGGSSYESLSGGERQIVNFAVGLSLADLAELQTDGPSYFMVLDEPFMALDARNSENLVNYLNRYLGSKKETILLVSNEENLKNLIPNRVNVVKEHGISRLEG
jgi:DNA repair exonuclease SbcCD ATPase subunit